MSLGGEDKLEILDLISRYADIVTRGDVEGWVSLFTPDGVWERKRGASGTSYDQTVRVEGSVALREMFVSHQFASPTQYLTANALVDGERGVAQGSCVIFVIEIREGSPTLVVVGNCEDKFEKTPDGWRFAYRGISLLG